MVYYTLYLGKANNYAYEKPTVLKEAWYLKSYCIIFKNVLGIDSKKSHTIINWQILTIYFIGVCLVRSVI